MRHLRGYQVLPTSLEFLESLLNMVSMNEAKQRLQLLVGHATSGYALHYNGKYLEFHQQEDVRY